MKVEKIYLVLNVYNLFYIEYVGFIRLGNNLGVNYQCRSLKEVSWSFDREVDILLVVDIGDLFF